MQSPKELGRYLKNARQGKSLTLRAVEKSTNISNAYLSQLECGKIKNPSPTMLHKLSQLYHLSYAAVMQLAGYPVPHKEGESKASRFAARLGPVTEEEENELLDYLDFLRSKRKRGDL